MSKLANVHPGEVLIEEFLKPLDITQYRLAKETGLTQTTISQITKGERAVTAETSLRFARYFGTTPQFWMGLQADYDLEEARREIGKELKKIHPMQEHRHP